VLVCTHTLQQLKRCFRTAETHKRYDYNSSHVRSQSFATEQWQSSVNQVQTSEKWVEPNQRSVPNQCSNIRSFSGPSLSLHAKFDQPRHPKNMWWQRGIFTSGALESLSPLIGQQMKKRVQAASAPQGCQICFFDVKFHKFDFFRDSRRQKNCLVFSHYCIWLFLEAVGTCYQISVFLNILLKSFIRIF